MVIVNDFKGDRVLSRIFYCVHGDEEDGTFPAHGAFEGFPEFSCLSRHVAISDYLIFLMAFAMTGATDTWLIAELTVSVPTTSNAPA